MTADPIRIYLSVDDAERRALMRAVLTAREDLVVVGESAVGEDAVWAAIEAHAEVVVVAGRGPGLTGARVVGALHDARPRVVVVAVAAAEQRPRSLTARRVAADCYLDPALPLTELCAAIAEQARRRGRQPV